MDVKYSSTFYKRFKKFVKVYMKLLYKIECNGIENIPKDQNYVISGNHLNILDSWLLILLTDENIRFMVDKKLYDTKIGEWFFKKLGTYDIDPEDTEKKGHLKAVAKSVELLKENEIVGIFPEGKTHPENVHIAFKGGVPIISKLGKTVLVPFGIKGTYKPFTKLEINIGEPINFNDLKLQKEKENIYFEQLIRDLEPYNGEIKYLEETIVKEDGKDKKIVLETNFNNKDEERTFYQKRMNEIKVRELKKK